MDLTGVLLLLWWTALHLCNAQPYCSIHQSTAGGWMKCSGTAVKDLATYMDEKAVFTKLTVEFGDIPQLPPDFTWPNQQYLDTLEVKYSHLGSIQEDAWFGYALTDIDLSHNNIRKINGTCFKGMNHLQRLVLNYNGLKDIDEYAFDDLTGLQELSLADNSLTELNMPLPASLMSLNISNNPLKSVNPRVFASAAALQYMYIDNVNLIDAPSLLKIMPKSLRFLSMKQTNTSALDARTFADYRTLVRLDISHNTISRMDEDTFRALTSLSVLFAEHNDLTIIPKTLKFLSNLQYLDLSHNQISSFDDDLLLSLPILNSLYISHNPLSHDRNYPIAKLGRLKTLHLEAVGLDENSPLLELLREDLLEVHLAHNNISVVTTNMFVYCDNLQTVDLSYNVIGEIQKGSFARTTRLKTLLLQGNQLLTISPNAFAMTHLERVDLSSNHIRQLPVGVFDALRNLTSLNLSDNREIGFIDADAFAKTPRLRRLSLRATNIADVPSRLLWNALFLEYLDLSDNRLSTIPVGSFDRLQYLLYLNLSHNHLRTIEKYNLYPLDRLQMLYLNGNRLQRVSGLECLIQIQNVRLEDNDWNCEALFKAVQTLDSRSVEYRRGTLQNSTHHLGGIPCTPRGDRVEKKDEEEDEEEWSDLGQVTVALLAVILVVAVCILLVKVYKVVARRRQLLVLRDAYRSSPNDYRSDCKAEYMSSTLTDEKNSLYNCYEVVE